MHGSAFLSPLGFAGMAGLGFFFLLAIIWTLAIKGYALWHAAKRNEKWWFVILLVVNTFGILELIYLIFVAKVLFNKNGKHALEHHHNHDHNHAHHDHVHHNHPPHSDSESTS
jgi:hypothetical protein